MGISILVTETSMLLRQVLRNLIDRRLEHFAPVPINRSLDLESTDPGVFPSFLDCGRVNAELEYAHGLLRSCRQRACVFRLEFSSKLCGTVPNLSFGDRTTGLLM
jgi:hypothetical protein